MSAQYVLVQWNPRKRAYDLCVAGVALAFLIASAGAGVLSHPAPRELSLEVVAIRSLAVCAFVLLHIILCIGPLARLWPVMLPLLANRRHLGVTMALVALAHAVLATAYYGAFGVDTPLRAVLSSGSFSSVRGFPFEWLGLAALLILLLLAATSHDFWLANLGPRVWKWLHMGVYGAYALLVLHVVLGSLQGDGGGLQRTLVFAGVGVVALLHGAAGLREWRKDRASAAQAVADGGWVRVASVDEIPESCAVVVCPRGGERVAIFRHQGALHAVTNACAHQGGPLGEGQIVDGCITCPWHGYQYLPHNGQSPPPFTEKIATYQLRVRGQDVELHVEPLPPGTPPAPVVLGEAQGHDA